MENPDRQRRSISSASRHGRGLRSPVGGPFLPPLRTRIDLFDQTLASTVDYLRGLWARQLDGAVFEVAALPRSIGPEPELPRWTVDRVSRTVTFYRLPIERLGRFPRRDDEGRRMVIESYVFRAVAELLDMDPWDLSPHRFRYL